MIETLDLDVSGLDIGDSLHIRDVVLPEGITTQEEGHLTVAVVAAPTVEPKAAEEELEEEAVEEEAAETQEESTES
jgi:large subunit ribosomal protein L25